MLVHKLINKGEIKIFRFRPELDYTVVPEEQAHEGVALTTLASFLGSWLRAATVDTELYSVSQDRHPPTSFLRMGSVNQFVALIHFILIFKKLPQI